MTSVGIIRCENYEPDTIQGKVNELLDMTGASAFTGKKILLKPNILYAESPEKAVTTHPEFLRAVILYFQSHGNTIFVGDSPAFQNQTAAGKKTRLKNVTEECGATWYDFSNAATIDSPEGKLVKSFQLADILKEVDTVISLPKMKTHELMYYTGAMKNLFGLVPGLNKSGFHLRFPEKNNFAQMIVDLNIAAKPAFAIMDAVVGMEGPGPGGGTPRHVGLLLASANVLALDMAASTIMGYRPMDIPILRKALESQHWLKQGEKIEYPALPPEELIIKDYKLIKKLKDNSVFRQYMPDFMFRILQSLTVRKPFFDPEKCVLCQECVRICPAKALTLKDSRISPDYKKCIRCYCCHEICSKHAIDLRRF
ncbi:MAG: DUF362 domain-containing protein [Spirochaetia bacterium]|nr:DUF362 domain-containing protein [Spirochaetia bacterium]